jgi:hypothetical protein
VSRIGLAWLGVPAAALAAVIAAELLGGAPLPPSVARAPDVAPARRSGTGPTVALEGRWVRTVLLRPLFDPTRRPPAGPAASTGSLRLSGVVVGPSGRSAIFEPAGGGEPVVVQVGAQLGGAVVRAIGTDGVLLAGADGPRVLRPSYGTTATLASAPHHRSLAARLSEGK